MDRRKAITSMIALAVAPALIKVEMLMPVKVHGPWVITTDAPLLLGFGPRIPKSMLATIQEIQDLYNMENSLYLEQITKIKEGANFLKGKEY